MFDKIMPLSEAVEGYELFDKMKVQKGMNERVQITTHVRLTCSSCLRGAEVAAHLNSSGSREGWGKVRAWRIDRKRRVDSCTSAI